MSEQAGAAILVATHGFLIPGIVYTLNRWVVLAFSHLLITCIASAYYHGCRGYNACIGPADSDYAIAVKIDHFYALGNVTLITYSIFARLALRNIATGRAAKIFGRTPSGMYFKEVFSIVSLFQICQAVILATVLVCDVQTSLVPPIVTFLITTLTLFLHFTLVTGGRLGFYSKFDIPLLLVSLLFTFASLYFFYDDSTFYSWTHTFWHIFSFVGTQFIIIATQQLRPVEMDKEKNAKHIDSETHSD